MLTFILQKLCLAVALVAAEVVWYILYRWLPPMDGPATIAFVLGYTLGAGVIWYLVYRYMPVVIEFAWDKYYDGA